jgi:hypothetical protein
LDTSAIATTCPSCGHAPFGPYCQRCGERAMRREDYSLRHVADEALEVASFDSRLLRSLRALLFRPGHLTAEYLRGRRAPYLRPFQLFLVGNLVFFFVQPIVQLNIFTSTFDAQLHQMPHSGLVRKLVYARVTPGTPEFDAYRVRFNATTQDHARTLIILMTPLFALGLKLLYWRRRRYYVEHLVFALHLYAFFLLLILLIMPILIALYLTALWLGGGPNVVSSFFQADLTYGLFTMAACLAYLYTAVRRVYGESRPAGAIKGALLVALLVILLQTFRLILFLTSFALS